MKPRTKVLLIISILVVYWAFLFFLLFQKDIKVVFSRILNLSPSLAILIVVPMFCVGIFSARSKRGYLMTVIVCFVNVLLSIWVFNGIPDLQTCLNLAVIHVSIVSFPPLISRLT